MASPKNERKTETIVREALRKHGYFEDDNSIIVEEQQSDMPRLPKLLEHASKQADGVGKPESRFLNSGSLHTTHPSSGAGWGEFGLLPLIHVEC